MKSKIRQFYSENILMSIMGHLMLVVIILVSVVAVAQRAEMVTPDRIQIMEIDLNNVKITGDETKLYNTDTPQPKPDTKPDIKPVPEPKPAPPPEPVAAKSDEQHDDFVDEKTDKKPEKTAETQQKTDTPVENTPKKKTIVRVNREVMSLDRTLSISVVDALRVALTRCWVVDTTRPDLADIRAVAHLKMRPNGTVADLWFEAASRAETDPAFAYVLDTIRAAIHTCEPLSMLPRSEFSKWESIQLTFYPTTGRVM